MSDSDDTDILLLIPPNYYLINAEKNLLHSELKVLQNRQFKSLQELKSLDLSCKQKFPKINLTQFAAMDLAVNKSSDAALMPPPEAPLMSASYQFLPAAKKAELNHINGRIHNMEKEGIIYNDNISDISSISANTVRTQFVSYERNREPVGMVHSTPKCMSSSFKEQQTGKHNKNYGKEFPSEQSGSNNKRERTHFGIGQTHAEHAGYIQSTLSLMPLPFKEQHPSGKNNNDDKDKCSIEIDNFLLNDSIVQNENYWQPRHNVDKRLEQQLKHNPVSNVIEDHQMEVNSSPSTMQMSKTGNDLISLSEIWGRSGQATAIAMSSQNSLKEEQLRRQHLEKTVRQLQSRLLEYQQRLSVAIEVDRSKDSALSNAQMEINSLNQELHMMNKSLQDCEQQRKSYDEKLETLQKELAQAVGLASKFQDKTEKLELELSTCTRTINETCNQYKQKLDELEIKAQASKRSEELAINELYKIRDKYAKSEHLHEKAKLHCDELEKENSTLKHQKDTLHACHQKQKCIAENLEEQRKSLKESLAHTLENETILRKKLEIQQKTLKSHYQQELEHVVSKKLKEFQEQLDKSEQTLKSEARERERLIAERAVKQLELINEKNELELNLLQEKHNEEVELYRIQLANASKKIDDMEMKLNVYKSKRADVAEKLHNVMETQWQKALEILTSPQNLTETTHTEFGHEAPSPDTNHTQNKAIYRTNSNKENDYETPKSSKKENNLNGIQQHETSPRDKLQAYIELLLSKSPTDFDKLDEILALSSKAKEAKNKVEKSVKRHFNSKPPWKA